MKTRLKYKKELVILSETLPYEVPITFTNKYYYNFLIKNSVEVTKSNITWKNENNTLDEIIKLLFGINKNIKIHSNKKTFDGFDSRMMLSIPYGYNISHKENRYRELTICHPRNQLQIIKFYKDYKELILYHCSISPFSIRKPDSVAKCIIHKDKSYYDSFSDDIGNIEESGKEYEHLRSFFVYKKYSNIHKFYESYTYHECEKKYNKLMKLDITKCFDSIYTHSIAWAIAGKDSVKDAIASGKHNALDKTFFGKFDRLMQQLNYNETNGIVIGPEFSRIFAEIILQSVDRDVFLKLQNNHKLFSQVNYEIFRYVDDYFIFYDKTEDKNIILQELQVSLKKYNLYLNDHKEKIYNKPLITEITIAKSKLAKLLSEKLSYKITVTDECVEDQENPVSIKHGKININSKSLITDFKIIIKESSVEYKDILNYALAVVERKCAKVIKDFTEIEKIGNTDNNFVKSVLDILSFVFFIYSVSPRVNTTMKLCRIINLFVMFFKTKNINSDYQHIVYKYIYDNICFLLKKNVNTEHTQVETLYLLVALRQLGKEYWLDTSMLKTYFNISNNNKIRMELNYFSITVLLFYIENKTRYSDIKHSLEKHILDRFTKRRKRLRKDAELIMLLLDVITCPHVTDELKYNLLKLYGITDRTMQNSIITFTPHWFTKWINFDFRKELDSKRMQEVY